MLVHMCDVCGKVIKDNDFVLCSLPTEEILKATDSRSLLLATYKTGKLNTQSMELCLSCANILNDFILTMKENLTEDTMT